MTPAQRLRNEIARIGYSAIIPDYVFSDVFASPPRDRMVSLAAFTNSPPSYRNAALAVVTDQNGRTVEEFVSEYRALGAPLLLVVEGENITAWQIRSEGGPRIVASTTQDKVQALFSERREAWGPRSIRRAKSTGLLNEPYQLDFVDAGLLTAIEGEIHAKLDRLLRDTLAEAVRAQSTGWELNDQVLFQIVFRFLAAKILHDRSHELAREWDPNDVGTVLDAISRYYNLPFLGIHRDFPGFDMAEAAWKHLNGGINFQNISADNLAFVYENTLVTPETRTQFGTHSTPWQVAEYIVGRVGIENHSPKDITIYEPCAGAGVFLVSALRHLKEMLPVEWTEEQRHNFLIPRLFGDEVDPFAVEVARLSLILADYPNHNGWQIERVDLFEGQTLATRMQQRRIILCNPPFEAFERGDRARYPAGIDTHLKPAAILNAALDAHPLALGFVMPRTFIQERLFANERRRLEALYASIELVHLPDRTFQESEDGAALVIAKEPRPPAPALVKLRSTEVADRDRLRFLRSGEITSHRDIMRVVVDEPMGELWIPRLADLWEFLGTYPNLATLARASWGLQWTYHQSEAFCMLPRPGFCRGVFNARGSTQFVISAEPGYLEYRPEFVRRGYGQPWERHKIIMNAGRRRRGAWRITAAVDTSGLLYSQQFYGLWPIRSASEEQLLALAAILNGPLASAYIATRSPERRLLKSAVEQIPIPRSLPLHLAPLVSEYIARCSVEVLIDVDAVRDLLTRIDAGVLEAYELPPRLEREMLETFRASTRPTAHDWSHWLPEDFRPFIPLDEYVSGQYKQATGNWLLNVEPFPEHEAAAIREILG